MQFTPTNLVYNQMDNHLRKRGTHDHGDGEEVSVGYGSRCGRQRGKDRRVLGRRTVV